MVPDTETSIGVIFLDNLKTISCTGIRTKILNARPILLNLGGPNVFISLKMKFLISKFLYNKYGPDVT